MNPSEKFPCDLCNKSFTRIGNTFYWDCSQKFDHFKPQPIFFAKTETVQLFGTVIIKNEIGSKVIWRSTKKLFTTKFDPSNAPTAARASAGRAPSRATSTASTWRRSSSSVASVRRTSGSKLKKASFAKSEDQQMCLRRKFLVCRFLYKSTYLPIFYTFFIDHGRSDKPGYVANLKIIECFNSRKSLQCFSKQLSFSRVNWNPSFPSMPTPKTTCGLKLQRFLNSKVDFFFFFFFYFWSRFSSNLSRHLKTQHVNGGALPISRPDKSLQPDETSQIAAEIL